MKRVGHALISTKGKGWGRLVWLKKAYLINLLFLFYKLQKVTLSSIFSGLRNVLNMEGGVMGFGVKLVEKQYLE